jgi:hypothetical protein
MKCWKIMVFFCGMLIYSCSNPNDRNLGGHYFLWEIISNHYNLIYSKDKNDGNKGGPVVINSEIVMFNFSNDFIVAKSIEGHYWIIDKRISVNTQDPIWEKKVLTGPLDTIQFVQYLNNKNIMLQLHYIKTNH